MIRFCSHKKSVSCRHLLRQVYFLLILIVLSGCATQPPLMPITDSDERISFKGFSVLPPAGRSWNWVGREVQDKSRFYNATFAKRKKQRTYIARVELLDASNNKFENIDDVREYVLSGFYSGEFDDDEIIIDPDTDYTLGFPCLRFDGENVTRSEKFPGMEFDHDAHGYMCLSPHDNKVLAHISYSRRTPKGEPHVAEKEEGERFIRSLELYPIEGFQ